MVIFLIKEGRRYRDFAQKLTLRERIELIQVIHVSIRGAVSRRDKITLRAQKRHKIDL